MSDFHLVDPQSWEYDLQSVYSAYVGYFQLHSVAWHDRTWGQLFETFEQFLAFSWPVITVTDARTGRAHIVTRMSSVVAFLKMIETRFGESLPRVDNMFVVKPFETSQRQLRHVDDWSTYKKLHASLPAVALATLKARVRAGDPNVIRGLWATQDKSFLSLDFEPFDRNSRSCVEWGYAVIRSSHLEAAGAWPPTPDTNYRKGHYIVSEHANASNKTSSIVSWQYAFGESQVIPKVKLPRIVQSVLSGLVSPDSETAANNVVLVGHGVQAIMHRLQEMKIKLPDNVLVLDVAYLERALFTTGERGPMNHRKTGQARLPESLLTLGGVLRSLGIDSPCVLTNAGNAAFMTMVAFQRMVDPKGVAAVTAKTVPNGVGVPGLEKRAGKGDRNAMGGNGHVKRAATVAARFFRPLSTTQSGSSMNGHGHGIGNGNSNGNGNGNGNAHRDGQGHGHGKEDLPPQMRTLGRGVSRGSADEMGRMHMSAKRASTFSALTTLPLLSRTDKHVQKGASLSVRRGSESTSGSGTGTGIGSGWMSPSTVAPDQRPYSMATRR